ncbi:hypothetical protein MAPG_11662 [Magnaporthiopsis poae ATCC 64411]|uniref:Uncharacterized protein n=1 Tax=Magnaporthiopsis poae (strain ATCC 64411 / 73-15) TaxID=644358 RepID=A0A0C4EFV4_MAGP6|nr:hypothetical protein MAPG_11662 [Magnaporthiopsis poae ATCC 64411]
MSRGKAISKPRVLRKLGHLESYEVAMHHGRFYTGTAVLCRYVIPRSVLETAAAEAGSANPEAAAVGRVLELAVARVVLEHPLLRVGHVGEATNNPAWVELDSVNLAEHIEWRFPDIGATAADEAEEGRQRRELVEEQLDIEFTEFETRPGWRVVASWLGRQRVDVLFLEHADGGAGNRKWRKKYPWFEPTSAMGNYVAVLTHRFFPETVTDMRREWAAAAAAAAAPGTLPLALRELVWTAAVMARSDINRRLEAGPKDNIMGAMRVIGNWSDFLRAKFKRVRETAWVVTNIGVIDGGEAETTADMEEDVGGRWTVDDAEFHCSADVLTAVFEISVVSVKGKGLKTAICWPEGALDKAIGEGLADNIDAWLRELAEDGNPSMANGASTTANLN